MQFRLHQEVGSCALIADYATACKRKTRRTRFGLAFAIMAHRMCLVPEPLRKRVSRHLLRIVMKEIVVFEQFVCEIHILIASLILPQCLCWSRSKVVFVTSKALVY